MPLASEHTYVVWSLTMPGDLIRSVCLVCGIPPELHGKNALAHARRVIDYDSVTRIDCDPDDGAGTPTTSDPRIEKPKPSLLAYAEQVLGFYGQPSARELIDTAAQRGVGLYLRPQGDVGLRNEDRLDRDLLRSLARAHDRIRDVLASGYQPPYAQPPLELAA